MGWSPIGPLATEGLAPPRSSPGRALCCHLEFYLVDPRAGAGRQVPGAARSAVLAAGVWGAVIASWDPLRCVCREMGDNQFFSHFPQLHCEHEQHFKRRVLFSYLLLFFWQSWKGTYVCICIPCCQVAPIALRKNQEKFIKVQKHCLLVFFQFFFGAVLFSQCLGKIGEGWQEAT